MTGGWIHEDCPAYAADDEIAEVIEDTLATGIRVDSMTIRTWYLLTCTVCAQQAIVTEIDLSPSDEAIAEQEAAEAWQAQYDDDPSPYAGTYSEE
jgi:hypothetical protein